MILRGAGRGVGGGGCGGRGDAASGTDVIESAATKLRAAEALAAPVNSRASDA